MMAGSAIRRPWWNTAVIAATVFLASCAMVQSSCAAETGKFHVNIGFSTKAFVNVPSEDIRVAIRILSQKVARNTVGSANAQIYDSIVDVERDLKAKKLDAVALTPEDFLELSSRMPLDPVLVTATSKGHEVELLLLARKDSRIRTFRELKNRAISIPAKVVQYGNMYFTWVEILLRREGFPNMESFFSSISEAQTPSRALMQVFFRQTDACVITGQVFELATELNPQIGRELTVIARLDKLAGGIIVFRDDLQEDRKQKLRQVLRTLHEDQEGRQLFLLFQLNRLIPYRHEYLRATELFLEEHQKLKNRVARKH